MLSSRGFPLALSWELDPPLSGGITLELVQNEAEGGLGCLSSTTASAPTLVLGGPGEVFHSRSPSRGRQSCRWEVGSGKGLPRASPSPSPLSPWLLGAETLQGGGVQPSSVLHVPQQAVGTAAAPSRLFVLRASPARGMFKGGLLWGAEPPPSLLPGREGKPQLLCAPLAGLEERDEMGWFSPALISPCSRGNDRLGAGRSPAHHQGAPVSSALGAQRHAGGWGRKRGAAVPCAPLPPGFLSPQRGGGSPGRPITVTREQGSAGGEETGGWHGPGNPHPHVGAASLP